VPWTRGVVDGVTTYRGERVPLLRTIRVNRSDFVIKPARNSGGTGVVLGWESTESDWDAAIDAALKSPHVVQERVVATNGSYPMADERGLEHRSLLFDWNPFVWNDGRVFGALSRLGEQSILNVNAGASLVPVYAASERCTFSNGGPAGRANQLP
jgi:uncharacterized circularly permuted ATP-grasp superfamily protein